MNNEIAQKYPDHLIWARTPQSYEILVSGIHARVAAQIAADDRSTRYLVSAQNRKINATQALASLVQFSWEREERKCAVMADSNGSLNASLVTQPNIANICDVQISYINQGSANDASYTVMVAPK